jgi:hypothetical protein
LLALLTLVVLAAPYSKGLACDAGAHGEMDASTMLMPEDAAPADQGDDGGCPDVMVCVGCGGMTPPVMAQVPFSPVHTDSISERAELEHDGILTPLTPPPRA